MEITTAKFKVYVFFFSIKLSNLDIHEEQKALFNRILIKKKKYRPMGIYIIAYSQHRNPRGERIDYIFLSSLALIKDLKDSPSWED